MADDSPRRPPRRGTTSSTPPFDYPLIQAPYVPPVPELDPELLQGLEEEVEEKERDRALARQNWEDSRQEREAMAAERRRIRDERAEEQAVATAERRRNTRRWVITTVIAVLALSVSIASYFKPSVPAQPSVPPPASTAPAAPGEAR